MFGNQYFEDEVIEFGVQYNSDEDEAEKVFVDCEEQPLLSMDDGFYKMWNEFHTVNLYYWSKITGVNKDVIIDKTNGRLIWLDHKKYEMNPDEKYTHYSTKNELLDGNVFAKYKDLKSANDVLGGIFDETVRLYEENLPDIIEGADIHVGFGAIWASILLVPFTKQLLKLLVPPEIEHVELSDGNSGWVVKCKIEPGKVLNRHTYGTERMSAVQIITHLLNGTPIKVSDYIPRADGKGNQEVFNKEETIKAKEKGKLILEEWYKFCHDNKTNEDMLQRMYMNRFGCVANAVYDGEGIDFPEMNPNIQFYSYHKKPIERMIMNDSTLLADKVGAGKTYEFLPAIFKMLQLGITKKAMVVSPNTLVDQTVRAYLEMFPSEKEKILKIRPNVEFAKKRRKETIEKIKSDKYNIIFIPSTSYDMLTLSKEYAFGLREQEIRECTVKMENSKSVHSKVKYKSELKKLNKKYEEYKAGFKDAETAVFDLLGITLLCVDEAHNYKNCSIEYRGGTIIGFPKASKKADNMLEKVRFIQKNGGKIIFSTATPTPNSLVDIYTMQKYLQPEELKMYKIYCFNDWIKSFGTEETTFQIDPAARAKFVTRISKFYNLPELMKLFGKITHFHDGNSEDAMIPQFEKYTDIIVEQSEPVKKFMNDIVERIEAVQSREVTRDEDNMLKITVQSGLVSVDPRLLDPDVDLTDQPCKIDRCADEVSHVYRDYPGTTQIIFCDVGTPKPGSFNVYDEMKYQLMKRGIPGDEIQFIHDVDTDRKLAELEEDFNDAKVRVLMGSTRMLGVGKNVQRRLKALHHLDVVWRPADFEQRNGRGLRRNNLNDSELIFRYATEKTSDSFRYQVLENKQRFISQFLSCSLDSTHREESDYAEIVLSYGEMKALALGDDRIRKRVETANELEYARISQREKKKELKKLKELKEVLPERISELKRLIIRTKRDIRHYEANKESLTKEEIYAFGEELLEALENNLERKEERLFEVFQGFKVLLPAGMKEGKKYVVLQGENMNRYTVDIDTDKPAGCTAKVRNGLKNMTVLLEERLNKLKDLRIQLEQAVKDLAKGNPYDKQVEELKKRLKELDEALESEGGSTV